MIAAKKKMFNKNISAAKEPTLDNFLNKDSLVFKLDNVKNVSDHTTIGVIRNNRYSFTDIIPFHLVKLANLLLSDNTVQVNEYVNCDKPFKFHLDMDDVEGLPNTLFSYKDNIISALQNIIGGNFQAEYVITGSDDYENKFHLIVPNLIMPDGNTYQNTCEKLREQIKAEIGFDLIKDSRYNSYKQNKRNKQVSLRLLGSSKNGIRHKVMKHNNYKNYSPEDAILTYIDDERRALTLNKFIPPKVKNPQTVITRDDITQQPLIITILDNLKVERFEAFETWRNIMWVMIANKFDSDTIHAYSAKAENYDANGTERLIQTFQFSDISVGTLLHYLKEDVGETEYKKILEPFKKDTSAIKIEPIVSDIQINQAVVSEYAPLLQQYKGLFIRSPCMTHKTQQFIKYVAENPEKSFLVVSFRRSQADGYNASLEEHGFINYQDIKEKVYKSKRLIVQIDSLHKVRGKYDCVYFDEAEYVLSHVSSFCKEKVLVMDVLRQLVIGCDNYVVTDALLCQATIDFFKNVKEHKTFVIDNDYKPFHDVAAVFLPLEDGSTAMTDYILSKLNEGKNIVIPTNSASQAYTLQEFIRQKHPQSKVGLMTAETDFIPVVEWVNYNVIMYTPTIVASNSFNALHFHELIGYFTSMSCGAEQFLQMIFRTRNLIDKKINIFYQQNSAFLPCVEDDVDVFLKNKYDILQSESGLKINVIKERIIKNDYYYLYRKYVCKTNLSKNKGISVLKGLLLHHGIKIEYDNGADACQSKVMSDAAFQDSVNRSNELTEIKETAETMRFERMMGAKDITSEEYETFKMKDTSVDEKQQMKKFLFHKKFELNPRETMYKEEFKFHIYQYMEKVYPQYKNAKLLFSKNIDELLQEQATIMVSDSIENEEKLHIKNNALKIKICNNIVQVLGFENMLDKKTVSGYKYQDIAQYIVDNETIFQTFFKGPMLDKVLSVKNEDQLQEKKVRTNITTYANKCLTDVLGGGASIKRTKANNGQYKISGVFEELNARSGGFIRFETNEEKEFRLLAMNAINRAKIDEYQPEIIIYEGDEIDDYEPETNKNTPESKQIKNMQKINEKISMLRQKGWKISN